jgi:hypothetical protein
MFDNCTIKYRNYNGIKSSIDIIYPSNSGVGFTKNVPLDPDNTDYQAIQEWVAKGNTIEEAD